MSLVEFIAEVWTDGTITVANQPMQPDEEDQPAALAVLAQCYAADALQQPAPLPEFDPVAALWAARYLYRATQLLLLRDLDETAVRVWLQEFGGPATPAAHYSADLLLRHLPDLLALSKGLAPADALVTRLTETLSHWPLSAAAGAHAPAADPAPLLAHAGLRRQYADRLTRTRALAPARHPATAELLRETLGQYAAELWPEFARLAAVPAIPVATLSEAERPD